MTLYPSNRMTLHAAALFAAATCCTAAATDASVAADSDTPHKQYQHQHLCLSAEQVDERMGRYAGDPASSSSPSTYVRPQQALTSLRIPGTASSKLFGDIDFDGKETRYPKSWRRKNSEISACPTLCFSFDDEEQDMQDLPFVVFTGRLQQSHIPYDTVIDRVFDGNEEMSNFMVTVVRCPYQYARKMFLSRKAFDREAPNYHNLSFGGWIEKATWRSNQMTRWLGRVDQDKSIWHSNNMIQSPPEYETFDDSYVISQNSLVAHGQESELLERAWQRLQKMAWFGVFDRLRESYDLLSFTFCRDGFEGKIFYEEEKNTATGKDILRFMRDDRKGGLDESTTDEELDRFETLITERNQLDIVLLERANKVLDERLKQMRDMKSRGVKCYFLRRIKVTCDAETTTSNNKATTTQEDTSGMGKIKAFGHVRPDHNSGRGDEL